MIHKTFIMDKLQNKKREVKKMATKKFTENKRRNTSIQQPVLVHTGKQIVSVTPKSEYSPLRVYSDKELELLTRSNPSFWATDAAEYADPMFVRNMCELYIDIAMLSGEAITTIKHFKIANLILALKKLAVEHPENYREICRFYGIDPEKMKSRKSFPKDTLSNLLNMCSWGYIELFFPNMQDNISKVAKKMHSCNAEMSDLTKAKYAHAYFLFIYTFNFMPYDFNRYIEELRKYDSNISESKKRQIFQETLSINSETEKGKIYDAIMLKNMYDALFKTLPDDSINVDMIEYFFNQIISKKDEFLIKEFLDLLNDEDINVFYYLNLVPLKYNEDIRLVKERIFPVGNWCTDIKLFVHANDPKFEKSISKAWRKYSENNFHFGKNVEGYKYPATFNHVASGTEYVQVGYMYASNPMRIRISDPNELGMILTHRMYYEQPELWK